ncbi:MAG: hypothetical protein ACM3ZV_11815 [Bacillota bacterium]
MQADRATRIEKGVDRAAAALFGLATGYAAFTWLGAQAQPLARLGESAVAALVSCLLCVRALAAVRPAPRKMPVPVFDVREIDSPELGELLLTDRFEPEPGAEEEPLVLDDILAELGPDSRVVRLFDPAAMPTPGQLNDRIERHLVRDPPPAACHDASQALHEALAELRRSLR